MANSNIRNNDKKSGEDAGEDSDPFSTLLDLEAQYHNEGYNLGVADGSRSGRIEGRIFGLEKGFEKFVEMGKLQGRAAVWRAAPGSSPASDQVPGTAAKRERLNRHLTRLHHLTDVETLSTDNSEDGVADFDERLKDARAKATLVSKLLGEEDEDAIAVNSALASPARTVKAGVKMKTNDGEKKTNEMEDFVGLPRGMKGND